MTAQYVFEVELNKSGDDECFEKIYLIGDSLLRVSHMAEYYVYEHNGGMFEFVVDIGSIKKVKGIGKILNADFLNEDDVDYNPAWPIELAKNMPDEDVLVFKCVCHEELRVPNIQFPYIVCNNCNLKIFRREIRNSGGMVYYQREDSLHSKDE